MTEEFDKELAKEIKKLQIETVTAEAVLKHIISESKNNIEYYQEEDKTVLVIPIDDSGIEIEFSNAEVVQKKETLQQLLSLVDKKLSLSEWIDYCSVNHLKLLSKSAKKYAVVPDGIKEIKDYYSKDSLLSVRIPDSVTTIGDEVFAYCSSLKKIIYDGTKAQWEKLKVNETQFRECKGTLTVKCTDEDIEIPILFIEDGILKSCNVNTVTVEIPAGVTTIGAGAFIDCSSLQKINIPAGVTTIEESAFEDCSSLQKINIPDSVTTIGESAFSECSSLQEIIYDGTMSQWEAIEKGEDWNECAPSFTVHCTDGDIKVGEYIEKD